MIRKEARVISLSEVVQKQLEQKGKKIRKVGADEKDKYLRMGYHVFVIDSRQFMIDPDLKVIELVS